MKRSDRRAIDAECEDCGKLFLHNCLHMISTGTDSTYARTAFYALFDENRVTVSAVARPNMSTAAVEQRPAKQTRGKARIRRTNHIQHIEQISIYKKSQNGPHHCGKARFEMHILRYFAYFKYKRVCVCVFGIFFDILNTSIGGCSY